MPDDPYDPTCIDCDEHYSEHTNGDINDVINHKFPLCEDCGTEAGHEHSETCSVPREDHEAEMRDAGRKERTLLW